MINWYLMISCDVWNGFKWLQPSTWRQGSFQYFCLQTADGRSLSLTGDHLLRLRRDDVWHWRRAKDACLAENHRGKGPPVMAIFHRWKWWSDFRTNPPQLSKGELGMQWRHFEIKKPCGCCRRYSLGVFFGGCHQSSRHGVTVVLTGRGGCHFFVVEHQEFGSCWMEAGVVYLVYFNYSGKFR